MADAPDMDKVTRLTVVDHTTGGRGRVYEEWDVSVRLDLQDDGRTLKVFVNDRLRTKTGKVLTDADIEALADEAEAGYDVSHLRPRRDEVAQPTEPGQEQAEDGSHGQGL